MKDVKINICEERDYGTYVKKIKWGLHKMACSNLLLSNEFNVSCAVHLMLNWKYSIYD